jgi:hypothetical protein
MTSQTTGTTPPTAAPSTDGRPPVPASVQRSAAESFRSQAERDGGGVMREFIDLIRHNRKWWLIPIIVVLLVLGLLVILGATGAAPFIYTLF